MTSTESLNLLARLCSTARDEGDLPSLSDADIGLIADTAADEGVSGWVLHRLTESYADWAHADALAKRLRAAAVSIVARNAHALGVEREIETLLSGIGTVRLKGIALIDSPYYQDVSHRPCGDIDIWVEPTRIYEARGILMTAGASASGSKDHHLESDNRPHLNPLMWHGMSIELHRSLFLKDKGWDLPGNLVDYAMEWHGARILRPDAMMYHLVMHAYKHYVWAEVCLKWVVDIALLLNGSDNMGELLRPLRETSADSAKAMNWAVGTAMPFLPAVKSKELETMGFTAIPYVSNTGGEVSTLRLKSLGISLIMGDLRTRLGHAHGLRAKMSAIAYTVRYEVSRTHKRYPADNLAVAIIKRILKKT